MAIRENTLMIDHMLGLTIHKSGIDTTDLFFAIDIDIDIYIYMYV